MSVGYVLINVEPGAEYEVFNAASELPFVVDVNLLFGDHDLILKIEAENMGLIAQLVVENIRSIEVFSTLRLWLAPNYELFFHSIQRHGFAEKVATEAQ